MRKAHEQLSIGVLLCASKEDKVVEYALNRTLSPALIAKYQTMLPDKNIADMWWENQNLNYGGQQNCPSQ